MRHPAKELLNPSRTMLVVQLFLIVATVGSYWQVGNFEFLNFDDPVYVWKNPQVTSGLTLGNLWWAVSNAYYDFWHPLTWWSHMLDCQLFGLKAGMHHLVNLGFHVANSLLLFRFLRQTTRAIWRSAIVAGLFALHPIHVESVAWVSERKDVLSGFFFLLTLLAYRKYAKIRDAALLAAPLPETRCSEILPDTSAGSRSPNGQVSWLWWYCLALASYAFGLMAKAMIVTVPFVLFLLDFWPLRRAPWPSLAAFWSCTPNLEKAAIKRLLSEKIPFLGLTLLSCAITYFGMESTWIQSSEVAPWSERWINLPISYVRYIGKIVWPSHLAALYPYPFPGHWRVWQWTGAALAIVTFSMLCLFWARRRPYVAVGWFMFLGMLVPVIGLVVFSPQMIADRYTYLASIGVTAALVWTLADFATRLRIPALISGVAAAAMLLGCGFLTWRQTAHWRNDLAVWTHCLAVTQDNLVAENNLGRTFFDLGRMSEAAQHFERGVEIKMRFKPDGSEFQRWYDLGTRFAAAGSMREATNFFAKALEIKPDQVESHAGMALALSELDDYARCIAEYREALRVTPNSPGILNNLAWELATCPASEIRNGQEAVGLATRACELTSYAEPVLIGTLAAALAEVGDFPSAMTNANRAAILAHEMGMEEIVANNESLMVLYRKRMPYHRDAVKN